MTAAQLFGSDVIGTSLRTGLGWLLTYGIHAAIAAVVAELLVRLTHPSAPDEHRLWKMAMVLPLATACIGVASGRPGFGRTVVAAWPAIVRIHEATPVVPAWAGGAVRAAALAAFVGAIAGAARFAVGVARLRRKVNDRRPSVDSRLRAALARVSTRFALGRVELIESPQVASPTAVGARVVCVPSGSTASFADDELDAILAHELAHLERRDPAWFFFAGLVEATLWMQPFNRRVVARLRRSAEIACDERAVAATGDALGLARGLSRFAHAALGAPGWRDAHPSLGGATRAPHALVERVRRLAGPAPSARLSRAGRVGIIAALVAISIASANVRVTFAGASRPASPRANGRTAAPGALDVAAASRRAVYLTNEETRLQTELNAAQAVAGDGPGATPARLLELEQDLRHAREERAWLERSVSKTVTP